MAGAPAFTWPMLGAQLVSRLLLQAHSCGLELDPLSLSRSSIHFLFRFKPTPAISLAPAKRSERGAMALAIPFLVCSEIDFMRRAHCHIAR